MSARPTIAVVGVGLSGPTLQDPRSIPEMVLDAVEAALADARLGFDAPDAVVTASVDLHDGLTASNLAITEVVGAVMKPEMRIAADGLCAAIHAACQIWAGAYDTVLVVAHGKASMAAQSQITQWAMDPAYFQALGIDFDICAALQASAAGLELGEIAPSCDAACAVVLQRALQPRVALRGVGHDLDSHDLGARDLASCSGFSRALSRARRVAELQPDASFDLLESSCRYPHERTLVSRACGVPARSSVGDVPVAAGLMALAAATEQLRRNAAVTRALAHGSWGPAGQGQAVAILEATGEARA